MSSFPVLAPHHERPRPFWWLVLAGVPTVLIFGTWGFWVRDGQVATVHAWIDALFHAIQLLILHVPHAECPATLGMEIGRWTAVLMVSLTAVRAFYAIFSDELSQVTLGLTKGHTVICGISPEVGQLVRASHDHHTARVVVISPSAHAAEISDCRAHGATIVVGDPTQSATLRSAGVLRARQLVAMCDDDRVNVDVGIQTRQMVESASRGGLSPLRCHVQLSDIDLRTTLQRTVLPAHHGARCQLSYFDFFDAAARRVLLERLPLDRGGLTETDPRQAHLVLLGFGRMGRSLAVRAAQLGHFANRRPLRISVIDREATRRQHALLFRYPAFPEICDAHFHQMEVESHDAMQMIEKWCADSTTLTSIAICFDRDTLVLEVALRLLPVLARCGVPAAARVSQRSSVGSLLAQPEAPANIGRWIKQFSLIDPAQPEPWVDSLNEAMARAIHEGYRAMQQSEPNDPPHAPAVRAWEDLGPGVQDSNRQQADHIAIKLGAIGCEIRPLADPRPGIDHFSPAEVELLAETEHARWYAERKLAGWTLGPKKDTFQKISPALISWSQLSEDVRQLDRNPVVLIPHVLRAAGLKAYRK